MVQLRKVAFIFVFLLGFSARGQNFPELSPERDEEYTLLIGGVIQSILNAAHDGKSEVVESLITDQYATALKRIQDFEKKNNAKRNPEEIILCNFNYYTIAKIDDVKIYEDIAFVEASVLFAPEFLQKRAGKKPQRGMAWAEWGGTAYDGEFINGNLGKVTFYFAKQRNRWKLHYAFFSAKPLEGLRQIQFLTSMKKIVK